MKRIWSKTKPPKGVLLNAGHPLASGLVGCWLMNEGSGNKIFDLSGNKNTGSFVNHTTWAPGKFGSCLSFDGTDDYVETNKTASQLGINGAKPKTVSAWACVDDFTGSQAHTVFGFGTNATGQDFALMTTNGDNNWYMNFWNIPPDIPFSVPNSKKVWTHFAITYDGTTIRIYANGSFVISEVWTLNTGNTRTVKIGAWLGYVNSYFKGYIDNVCIYNRALTATEVNQLYREPFAMFNKESIVLAAIAARIRNFGKFWWKK